MGRYYYGTARYDYKISIELNKLMDSILDKLKDHLDDCEWEADCDHIEIRASDTARFKHYHCDATLYDPPEDETELIDSIEGVDVEQLVLDALHDTKRIRTSVEIDYEDVEFEVDEPDDENDAYDRWRDRQFEED